MPIRQLGLLVAMTALTAACTGGTPTTPAKPAASAAEFPGRDPFTRTLGLELEGERVGMLVIYDEIPRHSDAKRAIPAGSYRILSTDNTELGFITPSGEVRRHTAPGYSESLGTYSLDQALWKFFGERGSVTIVPLVQPRSPA